MLGLHKNALAYAATSLASSMMNSIFYFYYVKLFLDRYHVPESWFHFAQIIYMIWNTVNDPLFGYFQDVSKFEFCRNRQKSILYGGPLWALCFLLPWFPWADGQIESLVAGMHLMISLCAYDALYTFVLLSQCALFAEISKQQQDRLRLVKYNQIAYVIGNGSVFVSSVISDNMNNLFNLQLYCIFIAIVACVCTRYAALNCKSKFSSMDQNSSRQVEAEEVMSFKGACLITWQILSNRNFLTFVIMNFFQVLHFTFGTNFLLIFADHLIPPDALPSLAKSAVYGASFLLPQLIILLGGDIISKFGSYRVVMYSFYFQIVLGTIVFIIGREHYYVLALFFILDMSIPTAAYSLNNISMSDIIDEDYTKNKRSHPRSSMVFATNALVTKPANSIAPMAVVAILNLYGYGELKEIGKPGAIIPSDSTHDAEEISQLHAVMFRLMCFVPVAFSVIQIISWRFYKLRSTHKSENKSIDV